MSVKNDKQTWGMFFPTSEKMPPITSCICSVCDDGASKLLGRECVVFKKREEHDNVMWCQQRESTTASIDKRHVCVSCLNPVHESCCLYVKRVSTSMDQRCGFPSFWTTVPKCLWCFQEAQKNMLELRQWRDPQWNDVIEFEWNSPIKVSDLRNLLKGFARKMKRAEPKWRVKPKESDDYLVPFPAWVPQAIKVKDERSESEESRIATMTSLDFQHLTIKLPGATPNAIEMWVSMLKFYLNQNMTTTDRVQLLPPSFFAKLLQEVRQGENELMRLCQADWLQQKLRYNGILMLPIVHDIILDFGLVVVVTPSHKRDDPIQCLIIDYVGDDAIATARFNHFAKPAVMQFVHCLWFLKVKENRKISVKQLYRKESAAQKAPKVGSMDLRTGLQLCLDLFKLITIVEEGQGLVEMEFFYAVITAGSLRSKLDSTTCCYKCDQNIPSYS